MSKVLATEISGQDTAAELAALKATTKAQDAKIKALSAQLRAKRARNCTPVEKKPIPVSTVCGKRGHNAVDCWDNFVTGRGPSQLDLAKANRDKKKADMAKRQPSIKETKDYTAELATVASTSDSDYSTCHASPYTVACVSVMMMIF
jgi:hypothetical protein